MMMARLFSMLVMMCAAIMMAHAVPAPAKLAIVAKEERASIVSEKIGKDFLPDAGIRDYEEKTVRDRVNALAYAKCLVMNDWYNQTWVDERLDKDENDEKAFEELRNSVIFFMNSELGCDDTNALQGMPETKLLAKCRNADSCP